MTMMLRIPLLLLALFTFQEASALDPNGVCNPCGLDGYYPTVNAVFSDGAGGSISCSQVQEWAGDRLNKHDFCSTCVSYSRTHCECKNSSGQLAPPLQYRSYTGGNCAVCTVPDYKMEVFPPDCVSGLCMKCMFWQRFATEDAFTTGQCSAVQSIMSNYCCSRRRNLRGDGQEKEEEEFQDDHDYENDPEYQELLRQLLEMKEEELLFPVKP